MKAFAAVVVSLCVCASAYADALVAKGTKTTLNVEYTFESSGKTQDKNDLHEWHVHRNAKLTAVLSAETAMALPALHAVEASQTADMKHTQERVAGAQQKMAPMMADVEKLMLKCGDDEACMTREIQAYGMNTKMTPELKSAKQDVQALSTPGTARYQLWSAGAQTGTYAIDEKRHDVVADPLCMPTLHCTRDETRKGAGELPLPPGAKPSLKNDPKTATGFALVEVDAVKNTVVMKLPVPLMALAYTQTSTTNSPEEKNSTKQDMMRFPGELKPITVALTGQLQDQSGTQSLKIDGKGSESGTLTIKWRFAAQ
jgi:hypothetical protein